MRRKAGSVFVTQWPNANPPRKTAIPANRLLNRLKAPTAPTQTKKNSVRSTPRYVRGLCRLLKTLFCRRVVAFVCIASPSRLQNAHDGSCGLEAVHGQMPHSQLRTL